MFCKVLGLGLTRECHLRSWKLSDGWHVPSYHTLHHTKKPFSLFVVSHLTKWVVHGRMDIQYIAWVIWRLRVRFLFVWGRVPGYFLSVIRTTASRVDCTLPYSQASMPRAGPARRPPIRTQNETQNRTEEHHASLAMREV